MTKPNDVHSHRALTEFKMLLERSNRERDFHDFFAKYSFFLSISLPMKIEPDDIRPLGRPGRSETDFIIVPGASTPVRGLIEIKPPRAKIVTISRVGVLTLTREAATAVQQLRVGSEEYDRLAMVPRPYSLASRLHLFIIMGRKQELLQIESQPALVEQFHDILSDVHLVTYDELMERYEAHLAKCASTHDESIVSPSSYDDFLWPLNTPTSMDRQMLHRRLGGARDGSISISEKSRDALVFCMHVSWQYGDLHEGWKSDGCFHFMGEAQPEGEPLSGRNLLLLEAATRKYTVRVFTGIDSNLVDYQGAFVLDSARPYYRNNPYKEGGCFVQTAYFRLCPLEHVNCPTHLYRFFSLGQSDGKAPYPYSVS